MNGITIDTSTGGPGAGSLHPNLIGATQMADDALAAIRAAAPPSTSAPASSSVPASSSAVASSSSAASATATVITGSATAPIAATGSDQRPTLTLGAVLLLAGTGLLLAIRRRPRAGAHRH